MARATLTFLTVLLLLGGCAGLRPLDRPQDFPLHSTDNGFFDLHWRLSREDGAVKAEGLVEAARQGGFSKVYLELLGLDKEGRVVSRGFGHTFSGKLERWERQPFVVSLRPTGNEERFEVRVWSFDWVRGGVG